MSYHSNHAMYVIGAHLYAIAAGSLHSSSSDLQLSSIQASFLLARMVLLHWAVVCSILESCSS